MARYRGRIKLVILDIAGTVCDGPQDLRRLYPNDDLKGVKSPVIAFEKVFARHNMNVGWATIRKPMGLFKREHLQKLLEDRTVAAEFQSAYGRNWKEQDIEELFTEFRAVVPEVAASEELIRPIEGVKGCIDQLRAAGILVGCDTGYPKEACDVIYRTLAEKYGIVFDVTADSENVRGRPTPFLVFDCMEKANIYPPEAVVKADDIEAGMFEGRNAGAWTVGLYATGDHDYERLARSEAKPDFLIPSAKYLPEIIFGQIEPRLRRGELPGEGLV